MSDIMDKIIADLIKGAQESTSGFIRGGRVGVEVQRDRGHEVKLAAETSTLTGGIPVLGPGLAALNASANTGSMGSGMLTGMGSGLGQIGGALSGAALGGLAGKGLGGLAGNPELGALLGTLLGGGSGLVGGGMLGAAGGRAIGHTEKESALEARFVDGMKAACVAFGIKEAFLPLVGSLLGGTLLKKGIGALAGGAGGKMLGGIASKVAPRIQGGMGGAAADMAGSMMGQSIGQKMMPQQQPPQPMMG